MLPPPGATIRLPPVTRGDFAAGRNLSLGEIRRRLDRTQAEIAVQRARLASQVGPNSDAAGGASPGVDGPDSGSSEGTEERLETLEAAVREGKLKVPNVRLSGFFQYDTIFFSQGAKNQAALGDIQNGSGFRRLRLIALGNLAEFTAFTMEMEFAGAGRPSFFDVWGEQRELPVFGAVRIGQFGQPVTMDSWTSSRHLEFMERDAAFQAFDPFRRVGIMAWRVTENERSMLAYSLYGTGTSIFNPATNSEDYNTLGDNLWGTQIGNEGGVSFALRSTHLLWYDEPSEGRYLVHVGGGVNVSKINGNGPGTKIYQASSAPETFVGDAGAGGDVTAAGTPFIVDTGKFLATSYNLYHTEIAGNYGSFHFQSEFLLTTVDQIGGRQLFYDGGYLQFGYFLTGESYKYLPLRGVLDYNVHPFSDFFSLRRGGVRGWGAWEPAFRWTYLNLSDPHVASYVNPSPGPPASPNPGILNESTLGMNWYWNQYMRMQFQWVHSMLDNNAHGFSTLESFGTRFQVEF
ncbi:MAG TPA: porin [Pirellulales bacterium]|nr:porin [Pirellulales bacterium]